MSTINGSEGSLISLETASAYCANYRATKPDDAPIAQLIGIDAINVLFAQPGAVALRMYYAINNDGKENLVLVATDANGNDLLEKIYDDTWTCPPYCSAANALNGY